MTDSLKLGLAGLGTVGGGTLRLLAARGKELAARAGRSIEVVAVSPGVGFGEYGEGHVRIALIENEHRLRQALRGIREMFRKDGLLKGAA